ncbi:MAG: ABC transporter ATP-binding protein, partial [Nitrosopumilus sp.]|nr:ABC transporter ATP-binding protein [Nitrosopumilus sp.]
QVFNESVEQHIRYGNPDINKEEIIKAAKLADAEEFIRELPLGYDTLIGENGVRLSGGQRQRLDLARAVARKSSILILDEPASGLDADAEEHFRRALVRIKENTGVTIVLIAHGFSTVVAADQIIVLKKGHVEESGTHEILMKTSTWYAPAFNKQHHAVLSAPLSDAQQ